MVREKRILKHEYAFLVQVILSIILLCFSCGNPVEVGPDPYMMSFVTIPAGSFEMGASLGEQGTEPDERPVHTVTFNYSFEMMTTEVTQSMWEEVMGSNPAGGCGVGENYPVHYVSWNDCQNFIDEMNNLDPWHTYRLPSESEWEYCCRAGAITRFYWGDDPSNTEIDNYAWWSCNSGSTTHPVAQKQSNAWGLYDMSGNVLEWCQDWYHDNYDGAPEDGSAWVDPPGVNRVLRGGRYNSEASNCRSAVRFCFTTGSCSPGLGFRIVRTVR